MRVASFSFVLAVALSASALVACGAPDVNGSGYRLGAGGADDDDDDKPKPSPKGGETTDTSPETGDVKPPPTQTDTTPTTPIADADKDGVADDVDCAPNDPSIAGTKLAVDDLTSDKQLFQPADGFAASWSYDAGYRQTRLANAPDLAILKKDAFVQEATVEVTAASTEISSDITPILRQMFITFGTKTSSGVVTAVGCGLEVDASQNPTQKTTVAQMNGSPSSITTTPLNRVDRTAVQAGEEFKMKATLKNGTLTCQVTIKGTQVTTAQANVGSVTGSIGLYTKQTKALFKQINACKLK